MTNLDLIRSSNRDLCFLIICGGFFQSGVKMANFSAHVYLVSCEDSNDIDMVIGNGRKTLCRPLVILDYFVEVPTPLIFSFL